MGHDVPERLVDLGRWHDPAPRPGDIAAVETDIQLSDGLATAPETERVMIEVDARTHPVLRGDVHRLQRFAEVLPLPRVQLEPPVDVLGLHGLARVSLRYQVIGV